MGILLLSREEMSGHAFVWTVTSRLSELFGISFLSIFHPFFFSFFYVTTVMMVTAAIFLKLFSQR